MLSSINYYYQQNSLNNRELAVLLWVFLAFIFCVWKPDMRKSFIPVLKALSHIKILIPIIIISIYALIEVFILSRLGIWKIFLLKDTVVWFLGTALVMLPNYEKVTIGGSNMKRLILDNIKLSFFLEFIANLYSFSFLIEFIMIPLLVIIGGMSALAENNKKYEPVLKITNVALTIYGITLVGNSLYAFFISITSILNLTILYNLLSYPVLTIFFIPCIYIFSLCAAYELLFIRVDWQLKNNKDLAKYAKLSMLKYANFDLGKIRSINHKLVLNLVDTTTKEQIADVINNVSN